MKIIAALTILFSILLSYRADAKISPVQLRCEYLINPSVIDVLNPRLSWVNVADEGEQGQRQTAWEITVAGTKENLLHGQSELWSSGKVLSNQSTNVYYAGEALMSRQDCWWRVRTWDKDGKISDWSQPAFWSMGLLKPEEWKAQWIGAPWQGEEAFTEACFGKSPTHASAGSPATQIVYCTERCHGSAGLCNGARFF